MILTLHCRGLARILLVKCFLASKRQTSRFEHYKPRGMRRRHLKVWQELVQLSSALWNIVDLCHSHSFVKTWTNDGLKVQNLNCIWWYSIQKCHLQHNISHISDSNRWCPKSLYITTSQQIISQRRLIDSSCLMTYLGMSLGMTLGHMSA